MARLLFEEQGIRTRRGRLVTDGTIYVVYTDAAGTVPADISATSGGPAIPGSAVVVADIAGLGPAAFRFYGPPDGQDTLYVRCLSDASLGVQEIEADTDERLDALEGGGGGGSHPDLATHDALGLATDTELSASVASGVATHAAAADPHTGYVLESAHTLVAHDTLGLATDAELTAHAGASDPHGDRAYADSVSQGLDPKASVLVKTTGNLTLSGEQTIDGVLTSASRVLVANQTAAEENGIYVTAAGAWSRATDADTSGEVTTGLYTYVEEGTTQTSSGWVLTTPAPITLGTTPLTFSQFSQAGQVFGGAGLVKTGNTLDVSAGPGLTVTADTVGISPGGVSATELAAAAVTDAKVDAAAAIAESKLALAFPTHAEDHAARHAAAGADPLAGYATSADLGTHESAVDPHQGYVLESAHTSDTHDTLGLVTDAILAAHEADTTVVHGIADTTSLATKPPVNANIRYVTKSGSNTNDGLSWGSAKLTIQAAHDSLSGAAGIVYVGKGEYTETLTITKSQVHFKGAGNKPANGTVIKPPSSSANGIVIGDAVTVGDVTVEDIGVVTENVGSYNGVGWLVRHAARIRLVHCFYYGEIETPPTATVGGTGLKLENVEGGMFDVYLAGATRGLHLVNEATQNVFTNLKGDNNWQDILIEGACGGNVFIMTKFVNGKGLTADGVWAGDIGGNGQIFINFNIDESLANQVRITSDNNIFMHGGDCPNTTTTVSGNNNIFDDFQLYGDGLTVTGANNVFRKPRLLGGSLIDAGTNTIIDGASITAGTITYGSAVAPRYGPANPATNNVQVFTTPGSATWTKPPGATSVEVIAIAGGGGGGSGRRGAAGSVRTGGGSGGSGGVTRRVLPASILGATETVAVGAAGVGGAAVTGNDSSGAAGVGGGQSTFGTNKVRAGQGGSGGAGGTGAATAGGAGAGMFAGNAGSASSATGLVGTAGTTGSETPGSGGSGGGITSADATSGGGAGGGLPQSMVAAGTGAGTAGTAPGGAGGAGTAATANSGLPGAGGGGGASSISGAGGAGGAGAIYGGGGGGGGASLNGNNSGAGGNGAAGIVICISSF